MQGRQLFSRDATLKTLVGRLDKRAVIKKTIITRDFTFEDFKKQYGEDALPMFAIQDAELHVFTPESESSPKAGQTLISLAPAKDQPSAGRTAGLIGMNRRTCSIRGMSSI